MSPLPLPTSKEGALFFILLVIISLILLPAASFGQSKKVYWTNNYEDGLYRSSPDGTNQEEILGNYNTMEDVAIDPDSKKMYFVDINDDVIYRANLDGSGIEEVVSSIYTVRGIALDLDAGKLYWTEQLAGEVHRSNLDGTDQEKLISGLNDPQGITVDTSNDRIYWVDGDGTSVHKAHIDGYNPTKIVDGSGASFEYIDLDLQAGKMYWTVFRHPGKSGIQRANLDGTNVEDVIRSNDVGNPGGLVVDPDQDLLWWGDSAGGSYRGIYRAKYDGSNMIKIASDVTSPSGMAYRPTKNMVYVTDYGEDKLVRMSQDGSSNEVLVHAALAHYGGVANDLNTGYLFLVDWQRGAIMRTTPDGTTVDSLITGLDRPSNISVAPQKKWILWTEDLHGSPAIRRARLDGSNPQTVISSLPSGANLAFNTSQEKIYWPEPSRDRIQRVNFDGSNIETFLSGISTGSEIAISSSGSIFWYDPDQGAIKTVNPNGSNQSVVISNKAKDPFDLHVDDDEQKLYWTAYDVDEVRRANLDGTNVETITSVYGSPIGVVTGPSTTVPVELASFDVHLADNRAQLSWTTASESNNAGFQVQRATSSGTFRPLGFVEGAGTSSAPQQYSFSDADLPSADALTYRLKQVDTDGTVTYHETQTIQLSTENLSLEVPSPHPVQTSATIRYSVPSESHVTLTAYDLLGRQVATLVDEKQREGRHSAELSGTPLASGTYILRLNTGESTETQKVTVVQ